MSNIDIIENKIYDFRNEESRDSLSRMLAFLNFKNIKIGFTNGCFDILHKGHIDYLSKAADKCGFLVLGLNTDNSVNRIKGNNRPINDEKARASIIATLRIIDMVVYFDEDTPIDLIDFIKPDMLFKGSDYKIEDIVGYEIVKAKGGHVETIKFTEGYSTSKIEQKILSYVKK